MRSNGPLSMDEISSARGRQRYKAHHQVKAILYAALSLLSCFPSRFRPVTNSLGLNFEASFCLSSRRQGTTCVEIGGHRWQSLSRPMVLQMAKKVAEATQKLCDKILTRTGHQEPLDLSIAHNNLITDVVLEATSGDRGFGLLDRAGFKLNFEKLTRSDVRAMFIFRFFPFTYISIKELAWYVGSLANQYTGIVR